MNRQKLAFSFAAAACVATLAVATLITVRNHGGRGEAPEVATSAESRWKKDELDAMEEAKKRNVPVFVDFFATWCEPCIELDREVFSSEAFQAKEKGWVLLRIDVSDEGPDAARMLAKYDVSGLPSLRFVLPNGARVGAQDVDGFAELSEVLERMTAVERLAVSTH